ncbi:hypothetical protein MP638_003422 [Amoeboaphelidium occidentale]|nr:hypothetical protein MP638_003422 [Amoeboaphelidium occidentale]
MDPKYYEVQCAGRLLAALNESQLTYSITPSYYRECVRKFRKDSAPESAFSKAREMLSQCQWDKLEGNDKSINFDEIEVDILLHAESLSAENVDLGKEFHLLRPDAPVKPEQILNRHISDKAIDVNANAYIVAEVTRDGTAAMAKKKMYQMERDLAFLLARARVNFNDPTITIGNIVRLVALITPSAQIEEVSKFLIEKKYGLPLVYSLLQQKRVYLGKVPPEGNSSIVSRSIRESFAASDSFSSISNRSRQKLVTISYEGKVMKMNVAYCTNWADFLGKIGEASGVLQLTKDMVSVYCFDRGISQTVHAVDALVEKETYYVVKVGEPVPEPIVPRTITFKTMDEFYEALRNESDDEFKKKFVTTAKKVFRDQGIGLKRLPGLTNEELERIGLKQWGLRQAILKVLGKDKS